MLTDDDESRPQASQNKVPLLANPPLDRLGVDELRAYVEGLRTEIARAEAEIARKQGMRAAAEGFFRSR